MNRMMGSSKTNAHTGHAGRDLNLKNSSVKRTAETTEENRRKHVKIAGSDRVKKIGFGKRKNCPLAGLNNRPHHYE